MPHFLNLTFGPQAPCIMHHSLSERGFSAKELACLHGVFYFIATYECFECFTGKSSPE